MIKLAAALCFLVASTASARAEDSPLTPDKLAEITARHAPSLVQVEWTAQYDKGEAPDSQRWSSWRAYSNSSRAADPDSWMGWENFIKQERPKSLGGYLIDETHVFTADPELHTRFLKSIRVRFADKVVNAKPSAFGASAQGLILELDSPLPGTKPLVFDPARPGPYLALNYTLTDGAWHTSLDSASGPFFASADGRNFSTASPNSIILDKTGAPIALGTGYHDAAGAWKKAPKDWPTISHNELQGLIAKADSTAAGCIVRTVVNFRSPRSDTGSGRYARYMSHSSGDDDVTEWNGLALIVDPTSALVLGKFAPKTTGRLEKVTLHLPDGSTVAGAFAGSLKDWGAFWVTLASPVSSHANLSKDSVLALRNKILLKGEISVRGDTRTAYFTQSRFSSFSTGFRGFIFPAADTGDGSSDANRAELNAYFSPAGALVGIPIERREQVAAQERSWYGGSETLLLPASLIADLANNRQTAIDPENRPLTEDEEHRLAWLGVEMQGMDPDLARANNIIEETNGGSSGGIVTHIYPDSPAAAADIQLGDVFLRLEIEGQPKPLEVSLGGSFDMGMMDQMWQHLDQVPLEYFDQMPKPWGSAETPLTRALTDVGFGTKFVAEILRDGQKLRKDFVVTQGPKHFDSASRYKAPEAIGITVRELTYEVRRYFQMSPDEPGVIISKIEEGSRAAVAGLKPMEILRTANDKPITSVADIENLVKAGGEVKFGVRRMTKGRTVKVKFDAPSTDESPAANPEDPDSALDPELDPAMDIGDLPLDLPTEDSLDEPADDQPAQSPAKPETGKPETGKPVRPK